MSSRKVVVIGAGLSGLAAAYRVQQQGFEVRVLERLDRPGGRVLTLRKQGYVIDAGPDAATVGYREWLALVDELGLKDQIVPSSGVLGAVRGDKVYDIDAAKPFAAALTPALSFGAKLRVALAAAKLPPILKGLDSFELVRSADRDDPSVNAWDYARKLFGEEVTEYLIDPAVRLTAGSGARECSQLGALVPLLSWTAPLINLHGGLDQVPRRLAERVPVTYGADVTRLDETADGVRVEYRDASGQLHVETAAHAVIASMYDVASRIWSPLASLVPSFEPALRNVKLISISLGYRRRCSSEAYVLAVPTREYPDCLLGFLQHNKAPDRAPAGHSLITLYTDTLAYERYDQKTDADIEAWAGDLAERLFPELKGHRELCEVTRWPRAGYLATPGFWQRTEALLQALPQHPRVHVAGDLFGAGSMESAARWGRRAAERIAEVEQIATAA